MRTNNKNSVSGKVGLIKIANDAHLRSYRAVRQIDHSRPQPPQKFAPEAFYPWVAKQREQADRVVVCYEAGCFGYEPARRLQALGVEALVIAAQNWDDQKKRQVNDKTDATVMCQRLSDYLDGHPKALSVVYQPTPHEEALRAEARQREQLRRHIQRMAAQGRGALLLQGISVRGRWWASPKWQSLGKKAPVWLIEQLGLWKELIEFMEPRLRKMDAKLRASYNPKTLLRGEGELTQVLLERELMDPRRFKNSRQVGNYFGLCPSEATTGNDRRMGSITKHGNPRLRRLIIEAAWRLCTYQPGYIRFGKFLPVLANSKAAGRKKAIVAVARRFAVDLWRLALGRCTAEQLGLKLKYPAAAAHA